ncbi:c-type cytochrome [Thalassotalea sp. PLHSN55]|uniref:c-type cytochrome n=1 Tax=Thalassotalea sp. PLHSN55 TaxID=3435888 RepID=UPI003F859384
MNVKKKSTYLQLTLLFISGFISTSVLAIEQGKVAFNENCKACHSLDRFNTGPSLVYIRDNYPDENHAAFLAWVKSPGKKNPDSIQMPPMAHLSDTVITQIHEYILTVSQHIKEQKDKPKFPPFKRPARKYPYVTRGVLPFTSPASIVVSLTPKLSIVWDSTIAKVRYAYPTFNSFNGEKKREENNKQILYRENDNTGFSFIQDQAIKFLGYELIEGYPEFHYQAGNMEVKEKITLGSTPHSFKRSFQISGIHQQDDKISLDLSHANKGGASSKIIASRGRLNNNILNLTATDVNNFSVEVVLP